MADWRLLSHPPVGCDRICCLPGRHGSQRSSKIRMRVNRSSRNEDRGRSRADALVQYASFSGAGWTGDVPSSYALSMGQRKLGRDVRTGWVKDPLHLYDKRYKLIAHCRRPHCEHKRDLPVSLLLRLFPRDTTIGEVANLLRCSKCGMRGARIRAEYVGPTRDERS